MPDARIDQSPPFNVFSARFSTSHLRYSQANVCGHGLDLLASLWWQAGLGRIQPSWGIWGTRRRTMQALERFWRSQQRCSSITQRSVALSDWISSSGVIGLCRITSKTSFSCALSTLAVAAAGTFPSQGSSLGECHFCASPSWWSPSLGSQSTKMSFL